MSELGLLYVMRIETRRHSIYYSVYLYASLFQGLAKILRQRFFLLLRLRPFKSPLLII